MGVYLSLKRLRCEEQIFALLLGLLVMVNVIGKRESNCHCKGECL